MKSYKQIIDKILKENEELKKEVHRLKMFIVDEISREEK